jgi:hypothetical protein
VVLAVGAVLVLLVGSVAVSARALDRAEWAVEGVTRVVQSALDRVFGHDEATVTRSDQSTEFSWSGRVAAGDVIEIKGVSGDVKAVASTGNRVEVVAVKAGRRSDPAEVRVEVVEHDAGVTVCAVYPTPSGEERDNVCAPGSEGRMNTRRNDVQVDFEVRVPAGVRFVGRTVNGDVEAEGLDSDVKAVTVNGDIDVSTLGFAEATTVNGSIRAVMGSNTFGDGVEFETVNGSIELDLPDDIDADLDASWVNGGLETDLPFLLQGQVARRQARGRLGDGGPRLALSTVNGSIRIY